MGTSPITITALTATPSLRGNKLVATVSATGPAANIPSLMLANVEFYASITNDFTTATYVGEGNPDFLHAGLIEEQTYYYWAKPRAVNGSTGAVFPVSPIAGVACKAIGMAGLAFGLANGKLVASVATNALTIAIKTTAGNDPSADDPVFIAFANPTLTTGSYQVRRIASATSVIATSGSTLGVDAGSPPFRLWVVLFDDDGTLRLGVALRSSEGGGVLPLNDLGIASSVAEGGAGAADGNFIYTTIAVTNKTYRIVGYCDWSSGLATPGTWNVAPDIVRLTTPGVMPGSVVQEVYDLNLGGGTNTSNVIPSDNTKPQSSEGANAQLSVQITPTSAANFLEISVVLHVSVSVAGEIIAALFKDSDVSATAVGVSTAGIADKFVPIHIRAVFYARSTAAIGWNVRFGPAAASTATLGAKFDTTLYNTLLVREFRG